MEKLGYNISKGEGAGTPDQFFAMTGCTAPTDVADRGCGDGPTRTYYHLSVEGWTWSYGGLWTQIQENYPATAPKILGSSGYMGVAGQFVASDVVDAAIQTEGLALEFYRGYNVSWHNPSQYFDQIGSLNANFTSYLARCNETRLQASDAMLQYAVITGDWDGIENISGVVRGKCVDDHFWHPPVCRQNASACLYFHYRRCWMGTGACHAKSYCLQHAIGACSCPKLCYLWSFANTGGWPFLLVAARPYIPVPQCQTSPLSTTGRQRSTKEGRLACTGSFSWH